MKLRKASSGSNVFVALLRGINVGGNNMLPMKDLARMFERAGATSVATYIQSGNVVFHAADAEGVKRRVSAAITKEFGYTIVIVVRSAAEMASLAKKNPFKDRAVDPKFLYVGFLEKVPEKSRAGALDPSRSPADEFKLSGCHLYVHYGSGAGKSKFTNAYVDATLGTVSPFRNLRTVEALVSMCAQKLPTK